MHAVEVVVLYHSQNNYRTAKEVLLSVVIEFTLSLARLLSFCTDLTSGDIQVITMIISKANIQCYLQENVLVLRANIILIKT